MHLLSAFSPLPSLPALFASPVSYTHRESYSHAARLVRFLDALNGFVEALVAVLFDALLL